MITGLTNPQVKQVCAYVKKKKERDRDGVFVAEGERLVTEAPRERIVSLYVSASYRPEKSGDAERFLASCGSGVQRVSDEVFAKMSDTKTPQGILAVVKRAEAPREVPASGKGPLLVLESIQDPGNLGTILRTAEAAGAAGILLCAGTADVYQPKVVRASMGSIFRVPLLPQKKESGFEETAKVLREKGYRIVCADADGDTDYDKYDWKQKTALVIGNEANGLSEEAAGGADTLLRIPMEGKNESLNAAVATAVLLFEAARQLRN